MIRVRDYIMGSLFDGEPSKELIEKCDASDTGGALAWRDENGIWQYVPGWDAERHRKHLGHEVFGVYLDG